MLESGMISHFNHPHPHYYTLLSIQFATKTKPQFEDRQFWAQTNICSRQGWSPAGTQHDNSRFPQPRSMDSWIHIYTPSFKFWNFTASGEGGARRRPGRGFRITESSNATTAKATQQSPNLTEDLLIYSQYICQSLVRFSWAIVVHQVGGLGGGISLAYNSVESRIISWRDYIGGC